MSLYNRKPTYGTAAWKAHQYKQGKIVGNEPSEVNYQYWNDQNHGKLVENGWDFYKFPRGEGFSLTTPSELIAQEAANKLRNENNDVRVVAGYNTNVLRIKLFSVIFNPKNK